MGMDYTNVVCGSENFIEIWVKPGSVQERAVLAAIGSTFKKKDEKGLKVGVESAILYRRPYTTYLFAPGSIDMKFLLRIDAEMERIMEAETPDVQTD